VSRDCDKAGTYDAKSLLAGAGCPTSRHLVSGTRVKVDVNLLVVRHVARNANRQTDRQTHRHTHSNSDRRRHTSAEKNLKY